MGEFMDQQFFKEMIIVYVCNHTHAWQRTAQAIAQGIPSKIGVSELEPILEQLIDIGVLDRCKVQAPSIVSENGVTVYAYELKKG